jgi:hypothetical protein
VVVGDVRGGGDEDVARGGEECPEEKGEPGDAGPAEEEIEEKDTGYVVAAVGGDNGGEKVEECEDGKCDHLWPFLGRDEGYVRRRGKVPNCQGLVPT